MRAKTLLLVSSCAVLLCARGSDAAFSLDLGLQVWAGNLGFSNGQGIHRNVTFTGGGLLLGPFPLRHAAHHREDQTSRTGFYSDPILRNISYTLFTYDEKVLSVGIGPFFGFFNNTSTLLKSGISTAVNSSSPDRLSLFSVGQLHRRGSLWTTGDYLQERNVISFGFYVPNAICTLWLDERQFEQKGARRYRHRQPHRIRVLHEHLPEEHTLPDHREVRLPEPVALLRHRRLSPPS